VIEFYEFMSISYAIDQSSLKLLNQKMT